MVADSLSRRLAVACIDLVRRQHDGPAVLAAAAADEYAHQIALVDRRPIRTPGNPKTPRTLEDRFLVTDHGPL